MFDTPFDYFPIEHPIDDSNHFELFTPTEDITNLLIETFLNPPDNIVPFELEWDFKDFDGVGDPEAEAEYWNQQDNPTSCALVAQIGIIESVHGENLPQEIEQFICEFAEEMHWFDPEEGTTPKNVGKILEVLGIPVDRSYDGTSTIEDIEAALINGDKVIVGLDAQEIWHPLRSGIDGAPIEQPWRGHAVWVTGVDHDQDGTKIILNDSGHPEGKMMVIDGEDFINAWNDSERFMAIAHTSEYSIV